jgi:hypothetical protein
MPPDVALFEIGADSKVALRPEWTKTSVDHFRQAYLARGKAWDVEFVEIKDADVADFGELYRLHHAVRGAIQIHHFGDLKLQRAKSRELQWSIGPGLGKLKATLGADYALLTVVREARATAGRSAMLGGLAALAMVAGGAIMVDAKPTAYATLVELESGRVLYASFVVQSLPGKFDPGRRTQQQEWRSPDFGDASDVGKVIDVLFKQLPAK